MVESELSSPTTTPTITELNAEPNSQKNSEFDKIVEKDLELDKLLLDAVQTIKKMHELKLEIKTKQNEFDEDKTRLLKSMYLTLHTQKLSNFNEILKAVEEIMR